MKKINVMILLCNFPCLLQSNRATIPEKNNKLEQKRLIYPLQRGYAACSPYTRQASSASPEVLGLVCGRSHLAEQF